MLTSIACSGLEGKGITSGLTRIYGYRTKSYGSPTSCYIQETPANYPICSTLKAECTLGDYPAYDSRCRTWYQDAAVSGSPTSVYFQQPRTSSGGQTVITGVTPIKSNQSSFGELYGVLNFNILAATLSDSVRGSLLISLNSSPHTAV